MSLEAREFIRRFLLHVLPEGFQKIRYFGLMANRNRRESLDLCRRLIEDAQIPAQPGPLKDWKQRFQELTGEDLSLCPHCNQGRLVRVQTWMPFSDVSTKHVTRYDTS
jgi:hypothetical protein